MFGIGMPEMILILAVALIVIGPKKLPDLARSLGKAMGEFKKATSDLKESMQIDDELKDLKTTFTDLDKEDKKPVNPTVSGTDKTSVDDDDPLKTADPKPKQDKTEEAMDNLKEAFNRSEKKDADTDVMDPEESDPFEENEKGEAKVDAETVTEKPKDV